MTPAAFGMSRPSPIQHDGLPTGPPKRPLGGVASPSPSTSSAHDDGILHLSFNVPFSSNLAGPDGDDILHATPAAIERWLHPEGTPEGTPTYRLPVHVKNLEALRRLCRDMTETTVDGRRLEAAVISSESKLIPALQRRPLKGLVTNVCLSGEAETVHRMRGRILRETPLALVCSVSVGKGPKTVIGGPIGHGAER